ncbi:MAG: septum formation protein Maf [Bacteroides sp.]|nr:septum formation protein Maf [Bacteroides sp.]MBD5289499.1 septum formation protein Maf [Bacteroides sp.]MBD5307205.1 septum formation protein Maf [Bacteroides sp.]
MKDMLRNLDKYTILLGSKSPRRRELLEMLRIPFNSIVIGIKEEYPASLPLTEVPEYLARLKAQAFADRLDCRELIITADTVVICDQEILGKPRNAEDAGKMLRKLSGKSHLVVTGVCVSTADRTESFSSTTTVRFAELTDEEISYYVDNFMPLDKAGAYGIQEWIGGVAVSGIDGSFYNVMGLPIHRLYQLLKTF